MNDYKIPEDIVDEICELYADKSVSVKEIISAYDLNINESMLYKFLPDIQTKIHCKYCNEFLYMKRPSRSGSVTSNKLFCTLCKHEVDQDETDWSCSCNNCVKSKKEIIQNMHNYEPISIDELFQNKYAMLSLYVLLKNYSEFNLEQKTWYIKRNPNWSKELNDAFESLIRSNILHISKNSPIDAFCWDHGEGNPSTSYYIYKVYYSISTFYLKQDENPLNREEITAKKDFPEKLLEKLSTLESILTLYSKLTFDEVLRYAIQTFEERGISPHISDIGLEKLNSVIYEVGFLSSLYIYNSRAMYISDSYITNKINRKYAENAALSSGISYIEFCKSKGWDPRAKKLNAPEFSIIFSTYANIIKQSGYEFLLSMSHKEISEFVTNYCSQNFLNDSSASSN